MAALGRPGYVNLGHSRDLQGRLGLGEMEHRCHQVLDHAYSHGVRYVDAARSYGAAESFLGSWLHSRGVAPGDLTVGSKWGYTYTAGWRVTAERHEVKDHSVSAFSRQLAESRGLIGPWLRLYQVHSVTADSPLMSDPDALAALSSLEADGVAVGLSLSGPEQVDVLAEAVETQVDGRNLFSVVQATWNLLEPSAEASLQAAHDRGMGVIVKEALANGRLAGREPAPSKALVELERAARDLGAGIDAVVLSAALARPWADVVLSGAATAAQLASNLRALELCWGELGLDDVAGSLAEEPRSYWSARRALVWN